MGYLDYAGLQYLWGKLKEKFAPKSHSHDDRYYTEAEVDGKLNSKLSLSGGTMNNGATISFADSGTWTAGNGTYPRDCGGLSWSGQSDGVHLYAEETSGDNLELVVRFTDDNSNGMSFRNNVGDTTARITANGEFIGNASTADGANSVNWSNVQNKPSTYTLAAHTHDDRYYTEVRLF